MKLAVKIYNTLKKAIPDHTNYQIENQVGISHGTMSAMYKGRTVSVKACKWLASQDSQHDNLYARAKQHDHDGKAKGGGRAKKKKHSLSDFPIHIQ
jgi:hypothetical protein